jgi:hypothetical protein
MQVYLVSTELPERATHPQYLEVPSSGAVEYPGGHRIRSAPLFAKWRLYMALKVSRASTRCT